jgi:transposase
MQMKRFIQGEHRTQGTLLPESLDDYVADTNPVRVVDVFVDELDLGKLGFAGVDPAATGRPSYHPAVLLKVYIYGYLNRIQSSRRLEREAQRNVELMWLTGRLMPDFKTIANFRKDNGKAIRSVCRQFVMLCQQLGLFTEVKLNESPDKQISLTDPDARSMKTRGTGIVGYNVQTAVDAKHHLIVAHEVTNVGSDRGQLTSIATQARDAIGTQELTAIADRGYFKSEEILACHEAGITVIAPKSTTSEAKADGRFDRADFIYDAANNAYRCPAGQRLIWRFSSIEHGLTLNRYWSSNCQTCSIKDQCTPSKQRRVTRWEHESVLEAMQTRLDHAPESMRIRRQTVEHPFGTIKSWMGSTHFLTKTLDRVGTEMSLHILAYNLKRVIQLLGTAALMEAMMA